MSTPGITNVKEFTAVEGQPGGLDELINAWLRVEPDVTIIDIKYKQPFARTHQLRWRWFYL